MPENNSTLKKKNQALREQVNALSEEIRKLKENITEHTSSPDRSVPSTEAALQLYSDAHDESQTFQADVSKELKRLSTWLAEISTRVDEIGKAIVKIVGMPELSEQESYSQTSVLCVKLFSDTGADVSHCTSCAAEECNSGSAETDNLQVCQKIVQGSCCASTKRRM